MQVSQEYRVRVQLLASRLIMFSDELPNDVLLDVQRILTTEAHESAAGPWDDLSSNFNPAKVLNDFFPDGAFYFSLTFSHK